MNYQPVYYTATHYDGMKCRKTIPMELMHGAREVEGWTAVVMLENRWPAYWPTHELTRVDEKP